MKRNRADSRREEKRKKGRIPASMMAGISHMELNGNREAIVESCDGVLEYDDEVVKIRCGKRIIRFCGRELGIKCLTADSLVVEGYIVSIEFIT